MLDLTKFETPTEKIKFTWDGLTKEFIITADLPRTLLKKYNGIMTSDIKKMPADEIYEQSEEYLIDILSLKNDSEEVKKVVSSWGTFQIQKVFMFYSEWVRKMMGDGEYTEKKEIKERIKLLTHFNGVVSLNDILHYPFIENVLYELYDEDIAGPEQKRKKDQRAAEIIKGMQGG